MCTVYSFMVYTRSVLALYDVHTECSGPGISWPKLCRRLCHHHRCLDAAHYSVLTFYLYCNINTVLTL